MKNIITRTIIGLTLAVALTASAQTLTEYKAKPPGKARVEGTSSIHDWWVEGQIISGLFSVDKETLLKGQPGDVKATASAIIPISSLHSSSGSPMDSVMYDHMEIEKQASYRRIVYTLDSLKITKAPAKAGDPIECVSKGDLVIHGVTNKIDMPVTIQPVEDDCLLIKGQIKLKMTSFNIKPPEPKIGLGLIKTGDDINVSIEWKVAPVKKD